MLLSHRCGGGGGVSVRWRFGRDRMCWIVG